MRTLLSALMVATLVMPMLAGAHAFPTRSTPKVGATLTSAPTAVKIWFDGQLEPVFSTLLVKDSAGAVVSSGKGRVDPQHPTLLEAALPHALPAGEYTVYWSVISRDGHHTEGHFAFTVK